MFIDLFQSNDARKNQFSVEGLEVLFDYLDSMEDGDYETEFDIVSICCDFVEYKDSDEYLNDKYKSEEIYKMFEEKMEELGFNREYPFEKLDDEKKELIREAMKEDIEEELNDETTLLKFSDDLDDGFIIANY